MANYSVKTDEGGQNYWDFEDVNKPVMEEDSYGTKRWYLDGCLHREGGPAIEYADGTKKWWLNDELHREDGPAIERADGSKVWYLNGEIIVSTGPDIEKALFYLSTYLQDQQYLRDQQEVNDND